jgi:DNA-binding winged helix-turn-helix (wHTH) protein
MDDCCSADILLFDGFRFDRRRGGCLYRLDEAGVPEPVPLCGRGLALLGLLLERHGELVPKDEIMRLVWRGRVVEEANLNVQIAKLRHILDQNREQGSCIQTISGHGYRFVAPVTPGHHTPMHATPDGPARQHPHLLIIVLSMADTGEELIQRCFAGGIPGNLTIDLSPITDMLAISHQAPAADRGEPVEIKQIRRADRAGRAPGEIARALQACVATFGRASRD